MTNEPGLTTNVAPGSSFLPAAAVQIIACAASADLSDVVVLVPNLYVIPALQKALQRAANAPTLLLPTITTLDLWAKSSAISHAIIPESRRLALLYGALRKSGWFSGIDLWRVASDALALINDCGRHGVALPHDAADFQRVIRQALRATDNHAIQFEARLVHELWRALQTNAENEIDEPGAHVLRLAQLAQQANRPLFVVGVADTTQAEDAFFRRYAQRRPVTIIAIGEPESCAASPLFALLSCAWNTAQSAQPLIERAAAFRAKHDLNPISNNLGLFSAQSLEQEAQAVALTARRWLFEGKRSIAIIAQDRLTARRARALLERNNILIADESGWTLSTTTASSVVMGWLELIATDFHFRNLLDLVRSPFLLSNIAQSEREALTSELETLLVASDYIGGINRLRPILERPGLSPNLDRIARLLLQSANLFTRKPRSLARWLSLLMQSLERLEVTDSLGADAAGADLLRLLRSLEAELDGDSETHSFAEWRRWLDQQLENASFRDVAIDSPVLLTHLGLTDGRAFDGVVILGADADHLPSTKETALFNESVSNQLGLPSGAARRALERQRLMLLIAQSGAVFITWQGAKDGEANLPSPYWAQLRVFQRLAYDCDLIDRELPAMMEFLARSQSVAVPITAPVLSMPQPHAPGLLPQRVTAYDYGSLIACPYQFFVRRMLGLRASDEVVEALEKKDYGELVHRILSQFHQRHPLVSNQADADLIAALHAITLAVFSDAPAEDYFSRAWRLRWEAIIPAYIEWQREREQQGWVWQATEISQERPLALATGQSVQLRGRLDRIDSRRDDDGAEQFAVLDYKTGNHTAIKKRAENPDEDSQLPFYGMIAESIPAVLAYVGLDDAPVKTFAMKGEVVDVIAMHSSRLEQTLNSIAEGANLPAHGVDAVCNYCEAQGICRRRYWEGGNGG